VAGVRAQTHQTHLTDPAYLVPPVPGGGPTPGIRWLSGNVARFADGAEHTRRRRHVTSVLAGMAVAELRPLAAERTRAVLGDGPVDLMARVARTVPVGVLVDALELPPVPAGSVAAIARAYQPGSGAEEPADQAVAELVEAFGGVPDEVTAARIAVLVQACDATAGLVGNAALVMLRPDENRPAETVVAETLRQDPPVRLTRRLAPETGTVVPVDLAASGLPFGAGPHECPGRAHAEAIAAGVVDALRGYRLVGPHVGYEPSAALRIPATLVVARPK
jgi:cytochrome P450